jgi:hypothetical protein
MNTTQASISLKEVRNKLLKIRRTSLLEEDFEENLLYTDQFIRDIKKAREQAEKGEYYTHEEAMIMLGFP